MHTFRTHTNLFPSKGDFYKRVHKIFLVCSATEYFLHRLGEGVIHWKGTVHMAGIKPTLLKQWNSTFPQHIKRDLKELFSGWASRSNRKALCLVREGEGCGEGNGFSLQSFKIIKNALKNKLINYVKKGWSFIEEEIGFQTSVWFG